MRWNRFCWLVLLLAVSSCRTELEFTDATVEASRDPSGDESTGGSSGGSDSGSGAGDGGGSGGAESSGTTGGGSTGGGEEEPPFVFPETDDVSLTVEARYSAASKWTYHVRTADVATECDGTETWKSDCIHGGEFRKVTTAETSCAGLEMVDRLNLFSWSCAVESGVATFTGELKDGKGLRDLVSSEGWLPNQVALTGGGDGVKGSADAAWWENSISALPDNSGVSASVEVLAATDTVYVLATSRESKGYNLNADHVAIVVLPDATLTWKAAAPSNVNSLGETTSPTARALIASGAQTGLWIEGDFSGNSTSTSGSQAQRVISLYDVDLAMLRNANASHGDTGVLATESRHLDFEGVVIANTGMVGLAGNGISVTQSSGSRLKSVRSSNSYGRGIYFHQVDYFFCEELKSVLTHSGNDGVAFGASSFVRAKAIFGANSSVGVKLSGVADSVFQEVYSTTNVSITGGQRLVVQGVTAFWGGSAWNVLFTHAGQMGGNFFSHFLTSSSGGVTIDGMERSTFSNFAIETIRHDEPWAFMSNNNFFPPAFWLKEGSHLKFAGNFLLRYHSDNYAQECHVGPGDDDEDGSYDEAWSSTSVGLDRGPTCAGSSANVITGGDSFVMPYATMVPDSVNASDDEGEGYYGSITDWGNFEHFTRAWTVAWDFLDTLDPTICRVFHEVDSETDHCGIVDLALFSGSPRVRNTTGDGATQNDAFVSGAACPSEAAGSQTITTWGGCSDAAYTTQGTCDAAAETWCPAVTALKNAFEVLMDGVGDDDGYCESSEACLYAPNFGAYQGHGTPGTCTFSNGTITGVTLYGHPVNGR